MKKKYLILRILSNWLESHSQLTVFPYSCQTMSLEPKLLLLVVLQFDMLPGNRPELRTLYRTYSACRLVAHLVLYLVVLLQVRGLFVVWQITV